MPKPDSNVRLAVITGASAGAGRAAALAFAARGTSVALLGRDEAALREVARAAEALGVRALPVAVDVSDSEAMEAAAQRIEDELGPIDVWVNNAMTTIFGPIETVTPEEFRRATEVTYLGYVWGTMAALRRMRQRNRGTIVQVGSALAYRAIPLQAAYCGAKFAIRGFTDSVRCELLHEGSDIHLTMVQMPALNTPQFDWAACRMPDAPQPVPPIFQPEVAAAAVVWAATHRRREVMVGMPTIKAIVANKLAPGLLDKYLARSCYQAQQRDTPVAADRRENLWRPVSGMHRTHGAFDDRATARSPALWLETHRTTALGALALAAIATLIARRAGPRR
jgi:short-subunit dehydrogenase